MKATVDSISGLGALMDRLSGQMLLAGRAESTLVCYGRVVRDLCVKIGKLPDQMDQDEIEDYLLGLKGRLSESTWHLHICGIRYLFREVYGGELSLNLPTAKRSRSLPVVLTHKELGQLFGGCKSLKHKCIFRLAYGSGMRSNELRLLRIADVDSGSMQLRIEQGKGRKDRYTVLPSSVLADLRTYYLAARPKVYLFNGQQKGQPLAKRSLQHALDKALRRSGIAKNATMHTLRHSFAVHAIEDGMDILSLQHLLGHADLQTTLL
ncbi:MAG: tyrosine-type recombinase/integrase [Bacteroidota bacterium]